MLKQSRIQKNRKKTIQIHLNNTKNRGSALIFFYNIFLYYIQIGNMAKTVKRKPRKNKTRKMTNTKKSHLVKVFFEILTTVKLYHWKTRSYAQHKATDELYAKLNENIDRFIEVLLGKDSSRIRMLEKRIDLIDTENVNDFKSRIFEYRSFLTQMHHDLDSKKDSDLLAIRDDILENINQFLYLMSFDKL